MKLRVLLLFTLALCSISQAQTALATLTGSVVDPSGASVANASLTARHLDTGIVVTGASSATGVYALTQLPVGEYEVEVERMGFKTFKRGGVTLAAAQILRLDVSLEVGVATEIVSVDAEASLLKTDTSAVVHNVTVSQIQNLPLTPINTGYPRDPLQFAQLLPGIRYVPLNQMLVNGLPTDQVQYRVDGQVMGNVRTLISTLTQSVQPSVDSIQEVAIQTSNYAAEFGSLGSGLFNFTMRSGTNRYHGSAYDYAVNEALNAHNPGTHTRNKIRRHDWGATFGGPIRVPKIYNGAGRSFFFFNWERFDQSQVIRTNPAGDPTVPTPSYRTGDFSRLTTLSGSRNLTVGTGALARDYRDPLGNSIAAGTLFDPNSTVQMTCNTSISPDCGTNGSLVFNRTALPGNRLPATMFDPVANAILDKYIPMPVGPRSGDVANNFYLPYDSQRLTILPSIKLDHSFSPATRASFLYQLTRTVSPINATGGAEGFNNTITAARGTFESQNRYVLNLDRTFTPTLQFHLGGGWAQFDMSDRAPMTDYNPAEDIGLRGVKLNRNFPRFFPTTATTAIGPLGGMAAMGPAIQQTQPERRPSANLSLTWIKNSHTVKFGGEWRMDMLPTSTFTNTAGLFSSSGFNGITSQPALGVAPVLSGVSNTGFPFADWLLGSVRGFTLNAPISYRVSKQQWGLFIQDTWRVNRKLILDYGVRWDLGTYAREDHGRNAAFGPNTPNPGAGGYRGAVIYESTCNCDIAKVYPFALGPRLGVAYNLNSRTVIRGGIGVAYNSTGNFFAVAANSAQAPTLATGFDNFKMRDGIPAGLNPIWPNFDPALNQPLGRILGMTQGPLIDPNAGRPARTYQWNVSLQRELSRNIVIEAAYVANRGVWQNAPALEDLNAISVAQLARYGFTVGNIDDANLLNTQFHLLSPAQRGILTQRGVAIPYAGFPTGPTVIEGTSQTAPTVLQSLRPFPQYSGPINPLLAPLGKSWYDSLQITGTKRYSNGLLVNVNYTWSKNLSMLGAPDIFNRSVGKNLTANNIPQQIRINFEYQVPHFGPQAPIVGNKWVSPIVSGWGLAAVIRYNSAPYLGRPASAGSQPISRWLQRGPGSAQLKTNPDGSYMNPWSVDWVDNSGKRRTDPLDINCHCFDPEKTVVFNPAVWESVPNGQWAADTSQLAFFRTQRTPYESVNFSRNFAFGKDRRYNLHLRVEFQNLFNRVSLPTPLILGQQFSAAQQRSADGRYIGGFGTFGNMRGIGYSSPRTGMFVGRFTF